MIKLVCLDPPFSSFHEHDRIIVLVGEEGIERQTHCRALGLNLLVASGEDLLPKFGTHTEDRTAANGSTNQPVSLSSARSGQCRCHWMAKPPAAFNPWLSHILQPGHTVPAVIAVKAGTNGVEVLLDAPADLGQKFIATNDTATAWRLTSDETDRQMEKDAGNAIPFAPMLLPVGDTPSGELLIDFEQLGAVSVTGGEHGRDGLLRNIVVAAATSPWFNDVEIVAIGVPGVRPTPGSKIVVPSDPQKWAEQAVTAAKRDAADTARSAHEDRMDGLGDDQTARLVVVGAGYAGVAQHLAVSAELAYSRSSVVSGSELVCRRSPFSSCCRDGVDA